MLARSSSNETHTAEIAEDIAIALRVGDTILLSGDLGAGKTTLARTIIRTIANNMQLEVPSPTYTICHSYEARFSILHMDLYRLQDMEELDELGWEEGLETGIALIEWPENCFQDIPDGAIKITIELENEGDRVFRFEGDQEY